MTTQAANTVNPENEVINLNSPLSFDNFNPEDIDMGETVNVTLLIDTSLSMAGLKDTLNDEFRFMIEAMQGWHQAPKIFTSIGTFDDKIQVLTGFQPIANVNVQKFNPNGGSTRLYDACREFLKNIIKQQNDSMRAGIQSKNILFVLTDGADNASDFDSAKDVNKMISHIMKDEQMMGSFGAVMCGIGNPTDFENARQQMGFQKLFVINPNLNEKEMKKEFRAVFGWLSQSISSASSAPGAVINF